MYDRLFDLDEIPEVPLFREPRGRRGAARGSPLDARFLNDYPPEWKCCSSCKGTGYDLRGFVFTDEPDLHHGEIVHHSVVVTLRTPGGATIATVHASELGGGRNALLAENALMLRRRFPCRVCKGMGSIKGRVRLESGHRCARCQHPFMTKADARMLDVEPSPGHWSPCDDRCTHGGPTRWSEGEYPAGGLPYGEAPDPVLEAEWRVLTVHHLDGDKANCRWWNLLAACQRCHLQIQGKVVMERIYPHEHSEWFKPYVAGYYAFVYLDEELTREQVADRMDELLALELAA